MATITETAVTAPVARAKPKDFRTNVWYLNKTMEEVLEYHKDGGTCTCNLFADEMDDTRSITVHDLRPDMAKITLEQNGFEIMSMVNRGWDLLNPAEVVYQRELNRYLDELAQAVKAHLGARSVTAFLSQVRPRCLKKEDPEARTPIKKYTVPRPHADFSPDSMPKIWQVLNIDNEPERWAEAEALVDDPNGTPRCQVLGAWKALSNVKSQPLCMVDSRTVPEHDWVKIPPSQKYAQNGGMWLLRHGEPGPTKHKWYYFSEQTPEEVLLFVHEDTDPNAVGRIAHTGLEKPGTEHIPDRQSVETRLFVVY